MDSRRNKLLMLLSIMITPLLAQETTSINSFSVEETGASVRITLTLSSEVNSSGSGCFMDKLTFVNDDTRSLSFRPRVPGTCEYTNDTIVGIMDVMDYIIAIQQPLLTSIENSFIVIEEASAINFLPGIQVNPISNPLRSTMFTTAQYTPTLVSFDIDYPANRLLLHFNALMDITTFNPNSLMLWGSNSSVAVSLINSRPPGDIQYVTTLCIPFTASDRIILVEANICHNADTCNCYFPSTLISDYKGLNLPIVIASNSIKVSVLRLASISASAVYMRLSLLYVGCSAIHNLAEDEVYVLRPYEFITRIDCFANSEINSSNIQPQISRGGSFSGSANATIDENIFYNWPHQTYLNFSARLPSHLYGQYICRSMIGYYVRNYIHDNNSNIELLTGSSVRVPFYDPLVISLFYGRYPSVDLRQLEIEIVDAVTESGIVVEPMINPINSFHVDIEYAQTPLNINGTYEIRIYNNQRSMVIARQSVIIEVTAPIITLIPEVATVFSGQMDIVLMCTTNSDNLPVLWYSDSTGRVLSNSNTYRVQISDDIRGYNCSVEDPVSRTIVASKIVLIREVTEILSVWRRGGVVENNSAIEIVNNLSPDLNLQCLEYINSTSTTLTWLLLPDTGPLIIPSDAKDADYRVVKAGNEANLTIVNTDGPFRGVVKCWSSSGLVVNIGVVEDIDNIEVMCEETRDYTWNIQWRETIAGSRDFQPCPMAGAGFALRQCNENGEWSESVDVTSCSSTSFINLETMYSMIYQLRNALSSTELNTTVSQLILDFVNITKPESSITLFPMDLNTSNELLESIIALLSEVTLPSPNVEIVNVFDNLLHVNNIDSWQVLTQDNSGGQILLNNMKLFGAYLLNSLAMNITRNGNEIFYSVMMINEYGQDIVYPADLARGAQTRLSASLLSQQEVTGIVHSIVNNLDVILPAPILNSTSNIMWRIASPIICSQLLTPSGITDTIVGDQLVITEFITDRILRAKNPMCVFWNSSDSGGRWSAATTGVFTNQTEEIENGEFKQFKIRCSSRRLAPFSVVVDTDTSEFDFSLMVYIGCGFVIFCSLLSLFSHLLSCVFDKLRQYSAVALLIHISFIVSILCAYITFLAGIEQALNHRIGCATVAGLLQYFFTAAFTWLMCEGLLVFYFKVFSKYCGLSIFIFIIGWGLPVLPTAISIGILHESYGTTTQCWFFFDGQVPSDILFGFIIPKLAIICITLVIMILSCWTNCVFGRKKIQPFVKKNAERILWLIWTSIFVFLIFLSASWVFALLLVNVHGLKPEILEWIFMVFSIILGVWMLIFSVAIMIINQKVDYERLLSPSDPVYPQSDPGRGKGYEFMTMSSERDLTGRRRSSIITGPPIVISNPVFGNNS